MNVLIINEFSNKAPFIKELTEHLGQVKINVLILDLKKHRLISYLPSGDLEIENTVNNSIVRYLIKFRILNIIFKLIYYNWIYSLPKFDHLSYHYIGSIYLFFHRRFSKRGKIKSSAILWGSDFYRTTSFDKVLKRKLYEKVDFIGIGNPLMKQHFLEQYPVFDNKVRQVVFGIKKLRDIDLVQSSKSVGELKGKWKIAIDKLIITIGYNGRLHQQHVKVLDRLENLLKSHSEKIHILIPFGYLGNESYKNQIISRLDDLGLSYTIIDSYMTDDKVAEYRIITDIAINAQTTDAMSASVQEHLYACNPVLAGDWLPYGYFQELGLVFEIFNWHDLPKKFKVLIDNLEKYKVSVRNNKEIIRKHSDWSSTIVGWERLYRNLN